MAVKILVVKGGDERVLDAVLASGSFAETLEFVRQNAPGWSFQESWEA